MSADAVAMVGSRPVGLEEFQKELARRAQAGGLNGSAEAQTKEALLREMIRFEVLYQKARAAGYDKDPQIASQIRRLITEKYQEDQLARLDHPKVSPQELVDYYRAHAERFGTREKVHAALIELQISRTAPPEKKVETAKKAQAILGEAVASASPDNTFGLLAQNYSEHQPSRYRGGDIGWLTVGDARALWDSALLAAIFKLNRPGELGPVIETPTAFYIVKLIERQPARVRPFEEVKEGIEYLVLREKAHQQEQALYDALQQGMNIRTNHALLESVRVPKTERRPPGLPGALSAEARKP